MQNTKDWDLITLDILKGDVNTFGHRCILSCDLYKYIFGLHTVLSSLRFFKKMEAASVWRSCGADSVSACRVPG